MELRFPRLCLRLRHRHALNLESLLVQEGVSGLQIELALLVNVQQRLVNLRGEAQRRLDVKSSGAQNSLPRCSCDQCGVQLFVRDGVHGAHVLDGLERASHVEVPLQLAVAITPRAVDLPASTLFVATVSEIAISSSSAIAWVAPFLVSVTLVVPSADIPVPSTMITAHVAPSTTIVTSHFLTAVALTASFNGARERNVVVSHGVLEINSRRALHVPGRNSGAVVCVRDNISVTVWAMVVGSRAILDICFHFTYN